MPPGESLTVGFRGILIVVATGFALVLPSCKSRERTGGKALLGNVPVLAVFLSPDPLYKLNPVRSLLAELQSNPNYPPPKVAEGAPLVLFEVKISGGDRVRVQEKGVLRGLHGGSLQPRAALRRVGRRTELSDYLAVVIDREGQPVYWVGISDPTRVFVETVTDARSGQIQGGIVKVKEGLLTATVPYVAGGKVQLFRPEPGVPFVQAKPLATAIFGPVPPPPSRLRAP